MGGNSRTPAQKGGFRKLGFRVSKISRLLERVVREMQVIGLYRVLHLLDITIFFVLFLFLVLCFFHFIRLHTDTSVGFGKLVSRLKFPYGLR